jgi:bacterioferritin-associated ferredoxin
VIVCVCANVNEQQLDTVIAGGARSVNAVGRRCGAGAGCGDCRHLIRERLRQHRDAATAPCADVVAVQDDLARVA